MTRFFSSTFTIVPAPSDDTDVHSKFDDGEGALVGAIVVQIDRQAAGEWQVTEPFVHGAVLVHAGGLELEHAVSGLQFVAGYITRQFLGGIVQCRQRPWRTSTMQGDGHPFDIEQQRPASLVGGKRRCAEWLSRCRSGAGIRHQGHRGRPNVKRCRYAGPVFGFSVLNRRPLSASRKQWRNTCQIDFEVY